MRMQILKQLQTSQNSCFGFALRNVFYMLILWLKN
jgi:hypothetical protein